MNSITKLSKLIAPPAYLVRSEREAVLVQLSTISLSLFKKHTRYFELLPCSAARRLADLQGHNSASYDLVDKIYKRLKKGGLIGEYPFLAALTASQEYCSDLQKYRDWLALVLLCCFQLAILEKHDSAIRDALRQIRLVATNEYHSSLLARLPLVSDFDSLDDLLIELEKLRLALKEEAQFDMRHFKGICFIQVAVRDAIRLSAGIMRKRNNSIKPVVELALQTQDGIDNNFSELKTITEPTSKQEEDESLSVQKTKTLRNNTKSKSHQSLAAKIYQAKNVAKQLQRREMSLPCDPNELTEYDVEHLTRFCIEHINEHEGAVGWLFTSLLSGRTVEFLHERNLRDHIFYDDHGNPYLRLIHQVPASKQPRELKKILPETTPFLFIPLPVELANWMSQKLTSPDIEKINRLIQKLNREHRVKLTANKIAGYLEHFLLNQGVDDMIISLLRNENYSSKPSLCYGSITLHLPLSCHSEFTKHLYELTGKELVLSPDLSNPDLLTGSALFVDDDVCSQLFKLLAENVFEDKNCWHFHNQYLIYVWALLTFCTGHRDVDAPLGKLSDYNADNGSWWISDKEQRSSLNARMVILPKTAKKQIDFFIEHLHALIKEAKFIDPDVEQRCIDALSGKKNLFFVIVQKRNRLETVDLTPSLIDKLFNFPLPHNWSRHYFRSLFLDKNISSELSNAWMGHVDHGSEGFDQFSGLSITDLKELSRVIEAKIIDLKMEAIQGWKTH